MWRVVLCLIALVIAGDVSAQSQGPAPPVGEQRQAQPNPAQENPKANPQTAAQAPITVNVLPTPKTEAERADEARERKEKADLDRRLVQFTADLATYTERLYYATLAVAIATICLVLATGGLAAFEFVQSRDMKAAIKAANDSASAAITSNQIAVTNAEQQLRAYVTVQEIKMITHRQPSTFPGTEFWRREVLGQIHTYEFAPILRNGGQTPATNVVSNVSLRRFAEGVPDDFAFPDTGSVGHGLIGPQTEWHAPAQSASAGIVTPNDAAPLLLWGSIEYDDIFTGTFRHRTEFCFQILAKTVPVTGETWIDFIPYSRYNNADGGCDADFDPHENKYH